MHAKSSVFLVLLVIALWAVPASGQVDVASATLKGTITDPHDRPWRYLSDSGSSAWDLQGRGRGARI
jgi:hypothetical protein